MLQIPGTIGCCILSYKSPKTLAATLETYKKNNLFSYFDEILILFQEISDHDREIAKQFNLPYISTDKNTGIYGGMRKLAESVNTDYVLMLENDCPLIEPESEVIRQLKLAKRRLQQEEIDVYRLRHRWQPGDKFDTIRKYKEYHLAEGENHNLHKTFLRLIRPGKYKRLMGSAVYVHENPQGTLYDKYIHPQPEGDFIIDSSVMPWTNLAAFCRREWLIEIILQYVEDRPSGRMVNDFQDVEKSLNCRWWRQQHFKIGVGLGLFSHQRLDF